MTESENNLPRDLQHPGGFVEATMDWINATAVCPQPTFALAAALCLAGTLYGRHFKDESGQRTNLYVMGVGFTSCGKDHALKAVSRALDACGASNLRLGQVTSDSAVEYALKRNPRFAMVIDECGHFFANVASSGAAGSPLHALKPALLELWSCANSCWKGKQRVPKNDRDSEPVLINSPHVCLFGMTQPQVFFDGVSCTDLRDGWLARNLFFISKTRPLPRFVPEPAVPARIRAEVLTWKDESAAVRTVPADGAALAVFNDFNLEIHRTRRTTSTARRWRTRAAWRSSSPWGATPGSRRSPGATPSTPARSCGTSWTTSYGPSGRPSPRRATRRRRSASSRWSRRRAAAASPRRSSRGGRSSSASRSATSTSTTSWRAAS